MTARQISLDVSTWTGQGKRGEASIGVLAAEQYVDAVVMKRLIGLRLGRGDVKEDERETGRRVYRSSLIELAAAAASSLNSS